MLWYCAGELLGEKFFKVKEKRTRARALGNSQKSGNKKVSTKASASKKIKKTVPKKLT